MAGTLTWSLLAQLGCRLRSCHSFVTNSQWSRWCRLMSVAKTRLNPPPNHHRWYTLITYNNPSQWLVSRLSFPSTHLQKHREKPEITRKSPMKSPSADAKSLSLLLVKVSLVCESKAGFSTLEQLKNAPKNESCTRIRWAKNARCLYISCKYSYIHICIIYIYIEIDR